MIEEAYKFCLDLAKLEIAGIIFTGIMRQDINPVLLFSIGGISTALFIAVGFFLLKVSKTEIKNKKSKK